MTSRSAVGVDRSQGEVFIDDLELQYAASLAIYGHCDTEKCWSSPEQVKATQSRSSLGIECIISGSVKKAKARYHTSGR